jgi:hypothetical protein
VSLFERLNEDSLHEYGGIGGRTAGARHPFRIPRANVSANKVKTPDQIANAKRRQAKRADTRAYLRQVALGEGRRPLIVLGEAQLDVGKTKIMAKNLLKLYTELKPHIGGTWTVGDDMKIKYDLRSFEKGSFTEYAFLSIERFFKQLDAPKERQTLVKKWSDSLQRMKTLFMKELAKDKAKARAEMKKKVNPAMLKKGMGVRAFKKGKEIYGHIAFVGDSKYQEGAKVYGISVGKTEKLIYVGADQIYQVWKPMPKSRPSDDSDFWHDAGKDMAAELGYKPKGSFSKKAIKKHFGWK